MESRKNQIKHKSIENENVGFDFSYGLVERERNIEAIDRFVVYGRELQLAGRNQKKEKNYIKFLARVIL